MSLNYSAGTHLYPNLSSVITNDKFEDCFFTTTASKVFTAYSVINNFLLIPLCTFILHKGLQQWRGKHSTATPAMSHSDSFIYHVVVIELIGVLGFSVMCCGIRSKNLLLFEVGYHLISITWYGETFFHLLTCLERYLAVVHPITYMSFRNERGITIRNVSIGCVWVLSTLESCLKAVQKISLMLDFCILIACVIIIFLCSLSVLCVLIRPRPGEQGHKRERLDQPKRKAFHTILVILSVLLLRFTWNFGWFVIYNFGRVGVSCVITISGIWFNLPCSLVLPLLFLYRAGMFACFKTSTVNDSKM